MSSKIIRHLNLFYGYSGGRLAGAERTQTLEDNVTRALIIVLARLHAEIPEVCKDLISDLTGLEVAGALAFDLQSFSDTSLLHKLQRSSRTIILLISRYGDKPNWSKLGIDRSLSSVARLDSDDVDRSRLLASIGKSLSKDEGFLGEIDGKKTAFSKLECQSIWELLHDARPDAWIYESENSTEQGLVLIESKVGANRISSAQVYRHASSRMGLAMEKEDLTKETLEGLTVSVSWSQLEKFLRRVPVRDDSVSHFLIQQFSEYLRMTGEILDLASLNRGYDEQTARTQFALLLERIDSILSDGQTPLTRLQRSKFGLWEAYTLKGDHNARFKIPWIAVHMDEKGVGCSLNFSSNPKKVASGLLNSREFDEVLAAILGGKQETLPRYHFSVMRSRFIDWKNGQQQGEKYEALCFRVCLAHLSLLGGEDGRISLLRLVESMLGGEKKELSLAIRFDWVDEDKAKDPKRESPLRRANYELFKSPARLADNIGEFVKTVLPVCVAQLSRDQQEI